MIELLVVLVVLCIVLWIIQILPIPASTFPIKTILYIVVAVIAIFYLLRFAGLA